MKYIVGLVKFAYVLITTICSLVLLLIMYVIGSEEGRFKVAKTLLERDGKEVHRVKKTKKDTGLKMKIGFESE